MEKMTDKRFNVPLAERMRPRRYEDILGQDHLLGEGQVLSEAFRTGRAFPAILWGPPGSGKTTIARMFGLYSGVEFRAFSAVTSGLKDLRMVVQEAEKRWGSIERMPTLLFVDEIHRFNKAQQDAFLPHVENGMIILVGATTENPSFEVISPLLSRMRVLVLRRLEGDSLLRILERALKDREKGLGGLVRDVSPECLEMIAEFSGGDARMALNNLEEAYHFASGGIDSGPASLTPEIIEKALSRKALTYDKDGEEHYNLISALHKSMRGSDEQASVYWLYRMLDAGEDPLFIARRMIRFASEDIGIADPNALSVALAAFEAWQKIGPPEAELALAQAAVYLASAPKSNALYLAEKAVKEEIKRSGHQPVPLHIRNAPTGLMKRLGYGRGYLYPHNYPGARVEQEYLPRGLKARRFYRPTERGLERRLRRGMRKK